MACDWLNSLLSGRAAGAARWQMRAVYQATSAQETTSDMWCLSLHNHGPHKYTLHCDMNEYRRIILNIFMLHIGLKHIMHTHTHLPRYAFHVVEYTSFEGRHIHVQDFGEMPMLSQFRSKAARLTKKGKSGFYESIFFFFVGHWVDKKQTTNKCRHGAGYGWMYGVFKCMVGWLVLN